MTVFFGTRLGKILIWQNSLRRESPNLKADVEGKSVYIVQNSPYFLVSFDTLKMDYIDFSQMFGSCYCQAERAAMGIRRLKTACRSTRRGESESDMNLIQIHTTDCINVEEVVQLFIGKSPQRLFFASQAFTKT